MAYCAAERVNSCFLVHTWCLQSARLNFDNIVAQLISVEEVIAQHAMLVPF